MKSLNIMKNIDNSILNIVDKIKATTEFQKMTDKYNLLEDNHQNIFTAVLMIITITLPLLIVLISYIFYSGVKTKVDLNEQMIEEGYAWAYDGGTKQKNFESLREIRRSFGTLVE